MPADTIATTETTFAGFRRIMAGFTGPTGFGAGFGNVSTPGSSSGLRILKAADTAPIAMPKPVNATIKGDNAPFDQFPFAPATLPTGDLKMGVKDLDFAAAAQSTATFTYGNWKMGIYLSRLLQLPNMMLLLHEDAHSQDAGSSGQVGINNLLYPNCQLIPINQSGIAFQAAGDELYHVNFRPFTTAPWGLLLGPGNFVSPDGICIPWFSNNPCAMYFAVADGTTQTFTVDHTPIDVASTQVSVVHLGTVSYPVPTSVTPSTKAVVLPTSTVVSGDLVSITYEFSKL